jgi:hypothetical protein
VASANEYSCAHGAQINFGYLTPYLNYGRGQWFFLNTQTEIFRVTISGSGRKNPGFNDWLKENMFPLSVVFAKILHP